MISKFSFNEFGSISLKYLSFIKKLVHDLSISGWMLSPVPEIMQDAYKSHDGTHRIAVERLFKRWMIDKNVRTYLVSYFLTFFFSHIFRQRQTL